MKLYTFSVLQNTFLEFSERLPYVVALVALDDGRRVAALVEGYRPELPIRVGMDLEPAGHTYNGLEVYRFCAQSRGAEVL